MVTILIMSEKIITPGLLKIKMIRNKSYDVILAEYDVTNNILSRDSNDIVYVVMWPKFGNSSISLREVIITKICKDLTEKKNFLTGGLGSSSIIWD